ncbi:MAG TPA: hypothetical protein VK843_19795 [Planctomycetota bacterium]|nr:hypothetical protein [Planctomycetota bacterium]
MKIRFASLAIPLFLAACHTGETNPEYSSSLAAVDDLSAHGRYSEALLAAEAFNQAHPGDAEGERQLRRAKAAVMLEQARMLCFADKNLEALELVREAKKVEPEEPVIVDWENKMQGKLAMIHTRDGDEFFASSNLDAAREEYEKALSYGPDDINAKAGLTQVLLQINYRRGMGQQYYEDGVHLLRDYWLQQAATRFAYTGKYQPKNDKAKVNKKAVDGQLALTRASLAHSLELQGLWAGARNEYRIALLMDPECAEAKTGYDRTRIEASAEDKLREIDRLIRAKKYEEAGVAIDSGLAVTKHQTDKFEGRRAEIEEARLEAGYQSALALESDQDFEEAVAAYDKLLAQRDYYKDTLARRDTLKGYIEKADLLFKQAMESTDPAQKLELLKRISTFWPRYKNVEQLIEQLKPVVAPVTEQKP